MEKYGKAALTHSDGLFKSELCLITNTSFHTAFCDFVVARMIIVIFAHLFVRLIRSQDITNLRFVTKSARSGKLEKMRFLATRFCGICVRIAPTSGVPL